MPNTPYETDTQLAKLYYDAQKIDQRRAMRLREVLEMAGAHYYYRGRQRVTDMTFEEAQEKLEPTMYKRNLRFGKTPRTALDALQAYVAEYQANRDEAYELERTYDGWSRFFLVTSSPGHIHSSMSCSTCYPTTRYAWLPHLSGKTEEEAVESQGPALCSICFPSAPVEWTKEKISKSDAEKRQQTTRASTRQTWAQEHETEVAFLNAYRETHENGGRFNEFFSSLCDGLQKYGSLTDPQLEALRKSMERQRKWERAAKEVQETQDEPERATERQLSFINRLMDERDMTLPQRREAREGIDAGLTKRTASKYIERLLALPKMEA